LAAREPFKGHLVGFISKAWSSETLGRGLNLVRSTSMSLANDPDAAEMMAELARLQENRLFQSLFDQSLSCTECYCKRYITPNITPMLIDNTLKNTITLKFLQNNLHIEQP